MSRLVLLLANLALVSGQAVNPVAKVISLLSDMQTTIKKEGKAEDARITKFSNNCELRSADLEYQIKTAKEDIEELSARISKAEGKKETLASTLEETSEGIASNEADLAAATSVRAKEAADFKAAEKDLLETSATVERAMSMLEKKEAKGESLVQVKGAGNLLQAVQAMMDASVIGHQDAKTLTAFLQDAQAPEPATYESKTGGVTEMLEDMLDKSKDQLMELRKKETEAKHSFEMVTQSLADEIKFAKAALEKAKKSQAEQARIKAEAEKDLQQTKISLTQDQKSLSDVTMDCKQEVADYQEETKSRGLETEALTAAKAALMESSGLSFLQLGSKSTIKSSQDLKHFEVVRMVRTLGQQLKDHQLVLLSRRMDGMLRSESGADVFGKIKTMISDMITTMQENLQAEATKKAYCDKEMGEAADKKAAKEDDLDDVSTKIDGTASKSASLKKQVVAIKKELTTLAETQANMTALRQEEKAIFKTKEPETVTGMEGVKSALKSLRDFYKSSGVKVTSGERKGAAGGVIGRLEDVEADMAMSLSQMRAAEKTAQTNYERDTQDMKLEKTQKEKDIEYKTAEAQRLDTELNNLNADQESMQTEMSAIMEFTKGLEAECLVTPESFAEKQAKRQQEIDGLKEALTALDATAGTALLQRGPRALRGQGVLKA
ncbi:BPM3 [Symbiodinium sp. CCMP2592]|nr:BPM3 [Symbiodinium sp. CCMP2592]